MPNAEIVAIGTELLLGETADTNTRFIARSLRGLGIDIFRTQTVGDDAGRIADAVREALGRSRIVITTGGLGPTVDDPTRSAIAAAVGREVEFRPELWDQIVERIGRYGRTPTENQKRQAYLPAGALPIENPVGTAPAFIVELPPAKGRGAKAQDPQVIVSLPGVPREMETLLTDAVIPYLQNRYDLHEMIKVRTLHVSGLGEGVIDEKVGDLEKLANPNVGLSAHSGVVDIRLAAKAATEAEADALIAAVEQDVRSRLGEDLFGADDETLEGVTLAALNSRGWTLACLESGLDGALLSRLARMANPVYRGGTTREVWKETILKTTQSLHEEFHTTVAIGVALVGDRTQQTIHLAVITPSGPQERQLHYGGHPKNAARWAVNYALDWLRRLAREAA
jgi:nicotinamide-nucleotide amidase